MQATKTKNPPCDVLIRLRTNYRFPELKIKGKGKCILYSAFTVVPHTQGAQVRITQFYLQITPYLPLPRKRSPDGASPDWGCEHLIAVYCSFICPEKKWKAEFSWLSVLQRTVYSHKWSSVSCKSSTGQAKFAGLYHFATQPTWITAPSKQSGKMSAT